MLLKLFGFLSLSLTDILDIFLVGIMIFMVFRWMRNSVALNIFLGILSIFILMVVVDALHMKLMSKVVSTFIDVGVLALIIIFQPEIRRFLMNFGNTTGIGNKTRAILDKLMGYQDTAIEAETINEITEACKTMSEQRTGALIVIPHKVNLGEVEKTGDIINSNVKKRLILNIFFKNSPLHDGAMIIHNDRIIAARCTLPITDRTNIPAQFGMRHKAAIGISQESDADVIVVSEETGRISFVKNGVITPIKNINELKLLLTQTSDNQENTKNDKE